MFLRPYTLINATINEVSPMHMILTQRERTILTLKRQSLSIKSVARELETSESAIVFHLKNIRTKQNLYYNDSIQKYYLVNVSASFFS